MASDAVTDVGSDALPTLLYAIKQVELAVRARMDELVRPMNITVLQYTALTVLRRRDGLTSAELARNSFVTAQTMGEMITALETRGLITRRTDPDNARRLTTSLTDAAHDLLDRLDNDIAGIEAQMVGDLSIRERTALRRYLSSCRRALGDAAQH